ncbi:unnamed protein product [Leptosia nina]|uniref:C2 domain-containing protein n=1 Tax=Leptosia nina TaxID=320188 RepID=A0AAV1JYR2_9NEOP
MNIIEARKLAWLNPHSANSYVIIVFGKKKYRTSLRRNMLEPYFNEMFTFEMYSSVQALLRTNIWLAIMEPRCYASSRILGEINLDLNVIWSQPNHQVNNKWVQLHAPRNVSFGPVGFLKLSVAVAFRDGVHIDSSSIKSDVIDENILCGLEQQRANYQITIYEAFGLPCNNMSGDKRFGKPPSTYVKVSFCGVVAKTAVQNRTTNPKYYEQVSMVDIFPNASRIRLDICSSDDSFKKPIASAQLNLENISHDGENGFLPTFGPSLLHMYGASCGLAAGDTGPYLRGSLLVSLNTIVPYYQHNIRSINIEPIAPLKQEGLWRTEEICLFCPILEVSMLDRRIVGKFCGVAVTFGEIPTTQMENEGSQKYHYTGCLNVIKTQPYGYLDLSSAFPVLQLATYLPDFRFRMYKHNMIEKIVDCLESNLKAIEQHIKFKNRSNDEIFEKINNSLSDTGCSILHFLELLGLCEDSCNAIKSQYSTEFDKKEDLHGWPDIIIWLLNDGSRVAYAKMPPRDLIYSSIPEQMGTNCGKIQTVHLKPVKCPYHPSALNGCSCVVGRVELLFWLGTYSEKSAFNHYLPPGYTLRQKNYDMCLKSPSLVIINTESSVWNQVLKMQKIISISPERLWTSPPMASVEVNFVDMSGKIEVVGRVLVKCSVDDRQEYEFAPRLEWYDLYKGPECTGQIFMSMQIIQIIEKLMKSTIYTPLEDSFVVAGVKDIETTELIEPLPINLIPAMATYKVDVYWWGLRDVNITRKPCVTLEIDKMTLKSEVISDRQVNSNFPKGRHSQIFEAPLNDDYCPLVNIRLLDSSTFGRTLYLGANTVKSAKKFMVEWLEKDERESSIHRTSIASSDFFQVSPNVCMKKCQSRENLNSASNISLNNIRNRRSNWQRLCCNSELDEEEYVLLPVNSVRNKQPRTKYNLPKQNGWWSRYLLSQEIYDTELEGQPQFSKFKDWCSTLKLYYDDKKIVERDKLYCGLLKAGVVIYKWPPPSNTIAVSSSGVDLTRGRLVLVGENDYNPPTIISNHDIEVLNSSLEIYIAALNVGTLRALLRRWESLTELVYVLGPLKWDVINWFARGEEWDICFFDDHPNNEPAKFLVRVYIVKALNLKTKEFAGKSDPYTVVSCGKKHFGNRANYVPSTLNPVFGKMYEFRCNLPEDYMISISLYDFNAIPPDELIGSTSIDLEDRIYSKHRARVGLAKQFSLSEPLKWRDSRKPSTILEELCHTNHLPSPMFLDANTVMVNGVKYVDESNERGNSLSTIEKKENLCLSILHKWHMIPVCGYSLVPEHVETRTLYRHETPGVEQGKLHMWIDIFPIQSDTNIPTPVDIKPLDIEDYELRLRINSIRDINLNRGSIELNLNSMPRGKQFSRANFEDLTANKVDLFRMGSHKGWWPIQIIDDKGVSQTGVIQMEMTLLPLEKAILMSFSLERESDIIPNLRYIIQFV